MGRKESLFLRIALIAVLVICILLFTFMAVFIRSKGNDTISEIGASYMTEINERISLHFASTIESRLSRLEYISEQVTPDEYPDYDEMLEEMCFIAKAKSLDHLSLCGWDGELQTVYNTDVTITDKDRFVRAIQSGQKYVSYGQCEDGCDVLVLAVPASYKMLSGKNSAALVGAIKLEYIESLLALDNDDSLVYSHIILEDGSFVIKSRNEPWSNYYTLVQTTFTGDDGKNGEDYYNELFNAINEGESYTCTFWRDVGNGKELRRLYCAALPYSDWYLITIMPYGIISETINSFNTSCIVLAIAAGVVIILMFVGISAYYIHTTNRRVADLEKAEQTALKASEAKSTFLSNMSHDIRTPMNAIVGMTAIASTNIDDKEQVQHCLSKITLSSKHLLGIINDVLDMSRIESGKMTLSVEQVSLPKIMDDIINIIQPQMKAKQQTFDVFIGNVPAEDVYCDSVRLNQVLMNILSNSVKFTPPGGRITVDLREEESEKGEDYVKVIIKVKDNGIGMSEEFKSRIFESFAREDKYRIQKTEGTGLGMAITKHIVDAMGGTIEVESEQSKGTEFTVTLDFERVTATEEDMILPDWNMLVVDDDEQLCRTAVDSLTEIGIKAEWTVSGASAVEIITERHKRGDDYHIILLDWQMPEMNGIETAREIRKNVGDNVPILLISAYDWSEIEPEAREAGINGFISKPLFKSTLFCGLRGYAKNLPAAEEKQEDSYNLEGKCVLVAEDNDINWEIACAFLKSMGMHAEHAEDGNACLYMFSYSEHGYYDAILMDLRMPQMSGYDSAKAIRKLDRPDRDIPIIAMSADAFSEDVQRCLDCGMNSHIAKPIDPKEVAKQLDLYINKQPTH